MRPKPRARSCIQHGRRHRGRALAALAFLLCLLASGGASGQPAEEAELTLDPITVTATRTPRRVSTVGDSVEVFTKEEMAQYFPGDFNDVLRHAVGGALLQSGGRGGTTNFFTRGSETNFTSMLIDGFKVSAPDGNVYQAEHLSPEWIGRAEILRGPQSPLYGSDAAAGVMNLIPDVGRPGDPLEVETGVRHGSYSTWEEVTKIRGGTERGGYLASLSRTDTSGRFQNDGYYRTVGTVALDHFPTEGAKIRLLYQGNQNRYGNASNNGATNTDIRLDDRFTDKELNAFSRNETQLVGLRLELRPAPWLEYIPRASFYEKDVLYEDKADVLDIGRSFFSPYQSKTTQTRYMVDNQVNLRFEGKKIGLDSLTESILTLGFEWEEERYFQQQNGSTSSTANQERRARSFYAQEQLTLFRDLTLTAGIRADDFDRGEDDVSAKLSGAYLFRSSGTKVRGAVGKGIKRPAFTDLFGVSIYNGNPHLESEKQENWEVGVDQTFLEGRLKLGATYFRSELRDLIAFNYSGFPNGTHYENINEARLKGAEFSLALMNWNYFTARAQYTTLDTEVMDDGNGQGGSLFVKGEELTRRPNWWWSTSLTYHPDRLVANLTVLGVGTRRDRDFRPYVDGSNGGAARTVNNPSYTRVDLAFGYDVVKDHKLAFRGGSSPLLRRATLEIKINNLLDEDYDEIYGYSSPGIHWFAGIRVFF